VSINLASGLASAGAADPNVVVTLPGGSTAAAAMVCSSQPSPWAAAQTGSNWISPIASCTSDQATGQFRYDVSFTLPSGATGLRLQASVLADDNASAQLNGHPLTLSNNGGSLNTLAALDTSDQSIFRSGSNTLSFFVNNQGGATGLDFKASVTSSGANGNAQAEDEGENHGQCVSEVAHDTEPGPGHGEAVSQAAHDCD
ncbi:MAG TPA: hypothetical protein VF937_10340, partial [Chloroflexota bacterium]